MALALIAAALTGASPADAAYMEYRGRLEVAGPVVEDLKLTILTEVRSRDNLHTHNESHFEVGLDYTVSPWLAVAPGYRHVTEQAGDAWRVEHRPTLDVTFSHSIWRLNFSNRNRIEYRMLPAREFFRCRFRIQVKARPAGLKWLEVFASEEPFYDFYAGEMNKNRLTLGLDVKVLDTIRLGLSYVLDSTKSRDGWVDLNAPTIAIKYRP